MMTHQTVTHLVHQVKDLLEGEFRQVSVLGEITNLSKSSAGHFYFNLSDKESGLSACLFRADALRNPLIQKCRDGDKVFCQGSLGVYTKRGTFQLIVKNMAPAGKGDLKAQFEELKLRLRNEGLFDQEHKKPIPAFPKRVAVITAQGAAALQDFINIYRRRSLWMDIVLIPSIVQGNQAAASLVKALQKAIGYSLENQKNGRLDSCFDVIVLTRGGGSLEDLWAFNDEALAWEIHNSPIPIISAVGHQVDNSISDYVADVRAETPSAAAELLTTSQVQIKQRVVQAKQTLTFKIRNAQREYSNRQKAISPVSLLSLMKARVFQSQSNFQKIRFVERVERSIDLENKNLRIDDNTERMKGVLAKKIEQTHHKLNRQIDRLDLLNPKHILKRGYTYTTTQEGKLVANHAAFSKMKDGSRINIHFYDGAGEAEKKGVKS
jgi:exodeoxyribonuclease VII large subunit